MDALAIVERRALSGPGIHGIEVALQRVFLVRGDDDALRLLVEAQHIEYHPRAFGELLDALALYAI